jgi:hypothetical protein
MAKQDTLKPLDLAVVFTLALRDGASTATFSQLGTVLGLSSSTVFESVKRLQTAGLVQPGSHEPNRSALLSFVEHGVRHVFPPTLGQEVRGVPTAHAGPALRHMFDAERALVWPDVDGPMRGTAMTPLYPNATGLPKRAPEVYEALTLVDALRVGQARERKAAVNALHASLGKRSSEAGRE